MAELSGIVEDESGSSIEGATVVAIRESDGSVAGVTTTGGGGGFSFTELSESETFHVAASYNDGSTDYGGRSFPFVEPFVATGPIDDFEDADILEYSGDTTPFEVQSGTVFEGTNALEMGNDDGSNHAIRSSSGLPRYPSAGATFGFRCYFENSESASEMHFGVQDASNYYRAITDPSVPFIGLDVIENGETTRLGTGSDTIPTGEWLEGVIEWNPNDEGQIIFTLNDAGGVMIADAEGGDETFSSGGIGWDGAVDSFSGDSVFYDLCELTSTGGDIGEGDSEILLEPNGTTSHSVGNGGSDYYTMSFVGAGTSATELSFWLWAEDLSPGEIYFGIWEDDGSGRADVNNPLWRSDVLQTSAPVSDPEKVSASVPGVSLPNNQRLHAGLEGEDGDPNLGNDHTMGVEFSDETTSTNENVHYSNDNGGSWTDWDNGPLAMELKTA